jgi:Holliday junction resolvase-like predicted endonuclease
VPEVGEELVGAWLRKIAECDFVQYNVAWRDKQGEIDVIGLNLVKKTAYICEVATHLATGLQYVKNGKLDNVPRLTHKFKGDVDYAREYLPEFRHCFQLWPPIIKHPMTDTVAHSQFKDLNDIRQYIWTCRQVEVKMVVNEDYLACVQQLRGLAAQETPASEFPVFRLLQILARLESHVDQLKKRAIDNKLILPCVRENQ